MSEYWKSTPKYWCKHCSVYVRDTKLERANHESTAKHQGSLKRFLRDLHRGHENQERDKDRAKREVERLNGVVGSSSSSPGGSGPSSSGPGATRPGLAAKGPATTTTATQAQRQQQWEQLADMGIDVPTELRKDMAMAGEWTVTNTRVVEETPKTKEDTTVDAIATGVRKRPKVEGEDEVENAFSGLFKRPKRWGRDTRDAPDDDAELDALLSGTLMTKKEEKVEPVADEVKTEQDESSQPLKKEPQEDDQLPEAIKSEAGIKLEESSAAGVEVPAVVFKKRKPKNIRQK